MFIIMHKIIRVNRVLKTVISSYINSQQSNWRQNLQHLACALRTAKHETTKLTPYFTNSGREMIINGREFDEIRNKPIGDHVESLDWKSKSLKSLHDIIRKNIQKASTTSKQRFDLRKRPVSYTMLKISFGSEIFHFLMLRNIFLQNLMKNLPDHIRLKGNWVLVSMNSKIEMVGLLQSIM